MANAMTRTLWISRWVLFVCTTAVVLTPRHGWAMASSRGVRVQQSTAAQPSNPTAATTCVAIVGTNDLHGTIEPEVIQDKVTGHAVRRGGLFALSGYVDILRDQYGERLILVDGGDVYQGTLASNLSYGKAMIAGFNAMGYTASAIGNHEFDFGAGDNSAPDADHFGVIKARIAEANFPFLAANVAESVTGATLSWPNVRPSTLVTLQGVTVGIVGALTMDTPNIVASNLIAGVTMRDPVASIQHEAAALRAAGAQVIVLAAHIGGKCKNWHDAHDISSCGQDEELFQILNAMPAGTVDVAVGGHTHAELGHFVNGVATIEAGARGRALTWVETCVGGTGRTPRLLPERTVIHAPMRTCLDTWADGTCDDAQSVPHDAKHAVHPAKFLGQPVVPDAAVVRALQPYLQNVKAAYDRPLPAWVPRPMMRDAPLGKDNLGEAVAAAIARTGKTRIGVQNRGGTRTDLPAGRVVYGRVFEILPFDNKVAVVQLTGTQIQRFVETLTVRFEGKPPHMFGLRLARRPNGAQVLLGPDGKPLQAQRRYHVATNDFLARGGEGLDQLFADVPADHKQYTNVLLRDALATWLERTYPRAMGK